MAESSQAGTPADLISYWLGLIVRRWQLILAITIVVAASAAISTEVLARVVPEYKARAEILLTPPKYQVSLEPKIRTTESGPATTSGTTSRAREDELKVIVLSPIVRQTIDSQLAGQLPTDRRSASWHTELSISGNLISVIGVADDPTIARMVADASAGAMVARLNDVYGQTPEDRGTLARKLADAKREYEDASQRFADFMKGSRIDELTRRIGERTTFLNRLTSVSEQQNGRTVAALISYYAALSELDSIARDVHALRDQVRAGGQSTASSAAHGISLLQLESRLINLGTRAGQTNTGEPVAHLIPGDQAGPGSQNAAATAPSASTPSNSTPSGAAQPATGVRIVVDTGGSAGSNDNLQYQVDVSALAGTSESSDRMLNDVDALLRTTDARRNEFLVAIDELSAEAASGVLGRTEPRISSTITTLSAEIQELQADLVAETARRDVVRADLSAAESARAALDAKLREADIAAATSGGVALIAATAQTPGARSFPPSAVYSLLMGALAGLLLGAVVAVGGELTAHWSRSVRPTPTNSPGDAVPSR